MAFRKRISPALAIAFLTVCFGCADELNAPNTVDEAPVLPPTNVQAQTLGNGTVQVSWDASSQPTINGYNLYRREVGAGNPNRLNGTRILSTEYVDDTTVIRKEYEYRVTAVNTKGKESRHTSVVVLVREVVEDGLGRVPPRQLEDN